MDVRDKILDIIENKGQVRASEVMNETGFSRAYVNRFLRELRDEGKIVLVGKTDRAVYVPADKESIRRAKENITTFRKVYENEDLSENDMFDDIKNQTGIFFDLQDNVKRIIRFAFTEMANNAIEHSQSKEVTVKAKRDKDSVRFDIIDSGIGIFNNIMRKRGLETQLEAIHYLLKGKETTDPESHSGEGIFFTSKIVDTITFKSGTKKLVFNNRIDDIFIEDINKTQGTKVIFSVDLDSNIEIDKIFQKFTSEGSYDFSKTEVIVHLFKIDDEYISRSQARRITAGLDKFKSVVLDFKDVETVGQAFADEIFRVWRNNNPDVDIDYKNTNENIEFMIKRAREKQ